MLQRPDYRKFRHEARMLIGERPNKLVFRDHNSADKPPLARSDPHLQAAACEV